MGVHPPPQSPPRGMIVNIYHFAISLLNRAVSPETRGNVYESVYGFSRGNPVMASFIATHILLSTTSLLLFLSFAGGVLLLATVSAALFVVFWVGLALMVLLPTLFVTVGLGCLVWGWGMCVWIGGRFVFEFVAGNGRGKGELVKVEKGQVNGDMGAHGTGGKDDNKGVFTDEKGKIVEVD